MLGSPLNTRLMPMFSSALQNKLYPYHLVLELCELLYMTGLALSSLER